MVVAISGKKARTVAQFGNSYKLITEDECPNAAQVDPYCEDATQQLAAENLCNVFGMDSLSACAGSVPTDAYYKECISDVCQVLKNKELSSEQKSEDTASIVCDALESYSFACSDRDIIVSFRDINMCPKECPETMVYSECVDKCSATCFNLYTLQTQDCLSQCFPGCECPTGTFLLDDKCVKAEECPCLYKEQRFPSGSKTYFDCNHCTCINARWDQCTNNSCPATCQVFGLQHFRTFDGITYDYQGKTDCIYTLVETDDDKLRITQRVNDVASDLNPKGYVTTDAVIIHFIDADNDTTEIVINMGSVKSITINNNNYKTLPRPWYDDYLIVKRVTSIFYLVQSFGFRILVDLNGRIYIRMAEYYAGKVAGLCGNMDGDTRNEFMNPNGIEGGIFENGNSWADPTVCEDGTGYDKSDIDICNIESNMAPLAKSTCEPLVDEAVWGECMQFVDQEYYRSKCEMDICAAGFSAKTRSICNTMAAMAKDCKTLGFDIDWLSGAPECQNLDQFNCKKDSLVYSNCASTCGYCEDLGIPDTKVLGITCGDQCLEGCVCPDGQSLDDNNECVDVATCPCYNDESQTFIANGESALHECTNCTCNGGKWDCPDVDCTKMCEAPKQYYIDFKLCGKTCATYLFQDRCSNDEISRRGCYCPEGKIQDKEGNCIKPEECPCEFEGKYYQRNDVVTSGCKELLCRNQKWIVTQENECPGLCWVSGDPHYTTFDGRHFSFMGSCGYVLTRTANFSITAENVACGQTGVTCTKLIEINSHGSIIQLVRGRDIVVNGNTLKVGASGFADFGFKVHQAGLFIRYVDEYGFQVLWDSGTRLYITMHPKYFGQVEGMCGNFDGKSENDFNQANSGTLSASAQEFGKSWSVRSPCPEISTSTASGWSPCKDRPERYTWAAEKCDIIRTGTLFADCRKKVLNFEQFALDCEYDACGCDQGGDCECLCTAIGNFAEVCSRAGVQVTWRSNALCPVMCPDGEIFKSCGPNCEKTCDNMQNALPQDCLTANCVEGCFCPFGMVRSTFDGKCVKEDSCPCIYYGVRYEAGAKVELECTQCECLRGNFECTGDPCPPVECKEEEYSCDTAKTCLNMSYVCDGIPQCIDQSDERNCKYECKIGEFKCHSGHKCIPITYLCDGHVDCEDSSDEQCEMICDPKYMFTCENTKACIPKEFKCDGSFDCGSDDTSDEDGCGMYIIKVTTKL
jgi:hypothetical protein